MGMGLISMRLLWQIPLCIDAEDAGRWWLVDGELNALDVDVDPPG